MRLRRLEIGVIALTLAFACFMGGYFTGRRGAVNIVTVTSQNGGTQTLGSVSQSGPGAGTSLATPVVTEEEAPNGFHPGASDASESTGTPATEQTTVPDGAPRGGDGRININYASRSELTDLPGIGDVLAGRIVDYRQANGPFSRTEDLRNVSGIGERRYEAIEDLVTVG